MEKTKTCCIIGGAEGQYTDDRLQEQFMWRIMGEILRLYRLGVRTFLCGMAAGTEIQAAEAVLEAAVQNLAPELEDGEELEP